MKRIDLVRGAILTLVLVLLLVASCHMASTGLPYLSKEREVGWVETILLLIF